MRALRFRLDHETPLHALRECENCGLFQKLPPVPPGSVAECPRCSKVLHRARRDPIDRPLALAITGLVLFVLALVLPFLELDLRGQVRTTTLAKLPTAFEYFGMWELNAVVAGTILFAPLAKLCVTIGVLAGLRQRRAPVWLPVLARWREWLDPWAMTEVFLLGVFVAYTRLQDLAYVRVGGAVYALGGLMLATVAVDALLDRDAMWESIGHQRGIHPAAPGTALIGCGTCGFVSTAAAGALCPRCDAILHKRKPDSLSRAWALVAAATLLYIPANVLPIMTVVRLGTTYRSTILGGVQELLIERMWPLALLVFMASIVVPVLKLLALTVMLVTTQRGTDWRLRGRTRLYRVVDVIGRWSMIDVFMVAILTALVRMGILASVTPELGAVAFASVVILTMLAAFSFDPRLMWDAARRVAPA